MNLLPALLDLDELLRRLAREEAELAAQAAELEGEVRKFEDIEKPAYEGWIRLSFGPQLAALEELVFRIQSLRILIRRVEELMESGQLHPREALFIARGLNPPECESQEEGPKHSDRVRGERWNEDEKEARREAKREAKREARRESRKATLRNEGAANAESALRLTTLYRHLARKLHPDSPQYLRHWPESRVQNIWGEVQKAYQASQWERLVAIQAWIESEGADADIGGRSVEKGSSVSEHHRRIRALRKACAQLEKRLSKLSVQPAWGFSTLRGKAREKLRKRAAQELDEELAQAQDALEALEGFIASIGPPRPPRAPGKRRRG